MTPILFALSASHEEARVLYSAKIDSLLSPVPPAA